MDKVSMEKDALLSHVSEIVGNLFQGNDLYGDRLDKDQMIQHLVSLFRNLPNEELKAIADEELLDRIDSILILEATAGMLNDLTPEQIEIFDAAVEGR